MLERPLRLGTRKSPLAMAQAEEARDRLVAAHPGLTVELVPVTASGDKVLDRPLAEIGGKALWTKELDAWLLGGEIDLAVHSLKDVETLRPAEITIAAILPREDVRDVLVGAASLDELPAGTRIGTSAPRRAAQALHLRPDCQVVGFRGNVQTRLAKLAAGEADVTLLALAGLNRLGNAAVGTPLNPREWLPAPGQGAIAIECRAADDATRQLLAAIDHLPSRQAVAAERALLAALGGNCHSPIAVFTEVVGDRLAMRAALLSPDGSDKVEARHSFAPGDPQGPRDLATQLLAQAGPAIRAHFDPPEAG
ncbi:hydroxymethylbilane synthase [Novosphingobium sp.]|uniref:hydroxymethylbilane synthase n=1 Tax=Novosphingobium sp. TaxID=1874826 RepID=UPI0025D3FD22|nr:hydroxymethylbilane synthase [Novosphingobium sp.]MCC6924560.1 hydroxymethylbilane synthase [Novosphingobium sp.]